MGFDLSHDRAYYLAEQQSGPMRLQLPIIHTGARYRAIDGQTPTWLAFYDLESIHVMSDPSYLILRDNRSEKGTKVLGSVPTKERQVGELISTHGSFSKKSSVIVWVEMSLKDVNNEVEYAV